MLAAIDTRHEAERHAARSMAGALHEAARAASLVVGIGQYIEHLRQPAPLQSQPVPPPNHGIAAQQSVDEEWRQMRNGANFANGQWPQEG